MQYPEDPTEFAHARLHERPSRRAVAPTIARPWHGQRPRIKRRFAMRLPPGGSERIEAVDDSVLVCCARGSLWITHDGDPKDIILGPQQSYRAESERPMEVHALAACVVEIEFEDEAVDA